MESTPIPAGMERELVSRLKDYGNIDQVLAKRRQLVEAWRKAHPVADGETSAPIKPLVKLEEHVKRTKDEPDEVWFNDDYNVTVRRHKEDKVFGNRGGMVQLGIAALEGNARHDWREFQAIKNQLAGPNTEAFELYPSEERLLDPSNYYTLWCFPGLNRIRVGREERRVLDADVALAPQRAFPKEKQDDKT